MANGVITWRELSAPNFSGVSQAMEAARKSFSGALTGLDEMLKQRQELAHQQILREDQNQLIRAQELIAGAANAEQLADLAPQLATLRETMRPESRGKLVGAESNRLSEIDQRLLQSQQANDLRTSVRLRPEANTAALGALTARPEDVPGLYQGLESHPEFARLLKEGLISSRDGITFNQGQKRFAEDEKEWAHKARLRPLQEDAARLNLDQGKFNYAHDIFKAANPKAEGMTFAQGLQFNEARAKGEAAVKAANNSLGNTDTHSGIYKELGSRFKNKEDLDYVTQQLNQVIGNPKYKDVSPQFVLNTLSGINTKQGLLQWGAGSRLVKELDKHLTTPEYAAGVITRDANVTRAQKELSDMISMAGATLGRSGQPAFKYSPESGNNGTGNPNSSSFVSGARGIRNNNPGNIVKSNVKWAGQVEGSDDNFVTFDSPESGIAALGKNLIAYNDKHGLNTIQDIISRWAPPHENDTKAYIDKVAKSIGVNPSEKIDIRNPDTLTKLTQAIIQHENGNQPYSANQISSGISLALGKPITKPTPATQTTPPETAAATEPTPVSTQSPVEDKPVPFEPTKDQLEKYRSELQELSSGSSNRIALTKESQQVHDYLREQRRLQEKGRIDEIAARELAKAAQVKGQLDGMYQDAIVRETAREGARNVSALDQAIELKKERERIAAQTQNIVPTDARKDLALKKLEEKAAAARKKAEEEEAKKKR